MALVDTPEVVSKIDPAETPLALLQDGPRPDVSLGVFFAGGGPKGIGPAESARLLDALDIRQNVDVVGGNSAGGATALAFAAGQSAEAVEGYYELFEKGFGDPVAAAIHRRPIADPVMLEERIASIDADKVCADSSTLFTCNRAVMNEARIEAVTSRESTPDTLREAVVDGMRLFPPFGSIRVDDQGRKLADPGVLGGGSEALDAALAGRTDVVVFDSKPYKEWGINWHGMALLGLWAQLNSDKGVNGFKTVAKAAVEQRRFINSYRETGKVIVQGENGQHETRVQVVHTGEHCLGGLAVSHGQSRQQLDECVKQAREATLRALEDPASVSLITRQIPESSTFDKAVDTAWQATMAMGRRAVSDIIGRRRVAF